MGTVHDQRYIRLISSLREIREANCVTQSELADTLNQPQSYVSKVENYERRIDLIELIDWLEVLGLSLSEYLETAGLTSRKESYSFVPALPIPGAVITVSNGIELPMQWQENVFNVLLEGASEEEYLDVEHGITNLYQQLNAPGNVIKNRDAICEAIDFAIAKLPKVNPSDIYHHIVYRLYLREYKRTQPDRSWVRAGGEALEIFVQNHYSTILGEHGIYIEALISKKNKIRALKEMGIWGQVGNSKLDVVLYGMNHTTPVIFGGIHVKASLAERVSDDVPCSRIMMANGLTSFLFTFDAKSFPPPTGNLVNIGELGSPSSPSDKRTYIEEHGDFDACFSYNLRTVPSPSKTPSGKKIFVGSFNESSDPLPSAIIAAWKRFKSKIR